jgi:hypothetical protein
MIIDSHDFVNLVTYWRLVKIVHLNENDIQELEWKNCRMTNLEIATVLNNFPNLLKLSAIDWKVPENYCIELNWKFKLLKLNYLKIAKCNEIVQFLFENDFVEDDTIIELEIDFNPADLLKNQRNVKQLTLRTKTLSHQDLNSVNLEKFILKPAQFESEISLQELFVQQSNLTHLDIVNINSCFKNNDQTFIELCQLKLRSLKINIDGIKCSVFNNYFKNLTQLVDLQMESVENTSELNAIYEHFCTMKFIYLKILHIESNSPSEYQVQRIGESLPALTNFKIKTSTPLALDCYLRHMKNLTSASISYDYALNFPLICNNFEQKFPGITELFLDGFNFGSDDLNSNETTLLKFISMFENLQILELDLNLKFNFKLLEKITAKLQNLHTLRGITLTQYGENYEKFDKSSVLDLIDMGRKLRSMSLEFRLKTIEMNTVRIKELLKKSFTFEMRTFGNLLIFNVSK